MKSPLTCSPLYLYRQRANGSADLTRWKQAPLVWYHRQRRRKEEVREELDDIEEGKQKDSELFCDMEVK